MNIYKVQLLEGLPLYKMKGYHMVLIFGSKSSKCRTFGKYNSNKKLKSVVNIHVGNDFDMLFWCCIGRDGCIFGKVNLKCS